MKINAMISLIGKIDGYYDDKVASGEKLPAGKAGMRIRAIWSFIVYGTSFSEFFNYRFYCRSRREKLTYMTRRQLPDFFDRYDPAEYRSRVGDKGQSAKYYGRWMRREQFTYECGKDAFSAFCEKYGRVFIKRTVGWGGEGARIEDVSTAEKRDAVWETLSPEFLVEPVIENCSEIKKLNPDSLNTVNVITLIVKGRPEIQFAMLRMGIGTITDNIHLGGIGAAIDIESGTVVTKASNRRYVQYDRHPITGEQITGLKLPFWKETLAMVSDAAMVTPELRYVSWDIAITENGPLLIEGNWDAEFHMKQVLSGRGFRKEFIEKLEADADAALERKTV